jgi:hypothetical protein
LPLFALDALRRAFVAARRLFEKRGFAGSPPICSFSLSSSCTATLMSSNSLT